MREGNFKILQQQAYEYVKNLILDQKMDYNRIYSESKLALEIGISRTPVRDAVHRLYQEGLIDIVPNKGFMLHKMTQRDIMETYEIRSAIEGYCSRKVAEDNRSDTVCKLIKELKASLGLQEEIFESNQDVEAFSTEDQHFHNLLVSYSDNEAFMEIFSQYMHKIKKLACYSLKREGRMLHTLEEHRNIYEAICQGDPHKAYEATILHMKAPLDINLEMVW